MSAAVFERLCKLEGVELGSGASDEEIAAVENALSLKIAGGYREFLKRFGWMRFVREGLLGLGENVPPELQLAAVTQRERTKAHPHLRIEYLPIKYDGWGNWYCLAPAGPRSPEPPVVLWEQEEGAQQVPEVMAPSFSEWLDELLEAIEEESSAASRE